MEKLSNKEEIVWTQIQPIKGIANWKKAKHPEIRNIFLLFMSGSFNPFVTETENASIASPMPTKTLFRKKSILFIL